MIFATLLCEMPISILGLARLQDGEQSSHVVRLQSLNDLELIEPMKATVRVTKLSYDSFLVHIDATVRLYLQCDRCLKKVQKIFKISTTEVFCDNPNEDQWPIVSNQIKVSEPLRQAILLKIPMSNICEPECI